MLDIEIKLFLKLQFQCRIVQVHLEYKVEAQSIKECEPNVSVITRDIIKDPLRIFLQVVPGAVLKHLEDKTNHKLLEKVRIGEVSPTCFCKMGETNHCWTACVLLGYQIVIGWKVPLSGHGGSVSGSTSQTPVMALQLQKVQDNHFITR